MTALYTSSGAARGGAQIKMAGAHNLAQLQAPTAAQAIELWVDNVQSFGIFQRFRSQIISVGMGGVVGLNYVPVVHYLDRIAKDEDDWEDLFSDFQACETAMVEAMGKTK